MQIIFDDARHHWVLSTLNEGEVSIHDSLETSVISPVFEKQLVRLYGPTMSSDATGLFVSASPVQQQKGTCDCGLFAVAFAFHVASGGDSTDLTLDQTKMRSHLKRCFEKKLLSIFPTTSERVVRSKPTNIVIPVYCQCRCPDSMDEMIQCDRCDSWLHFRCARVRRAPAGQWFCSVCR